MPKCIPIMCLLLAGILAAAPHAAAQTYTNDMVVWDAGMQWQFNQATDPAGRITVELDNNLNFQNGTIHAAPHPTSWASASAGAAGGVPKATGTLYEFTLGSEPPGPYGVMTSGCAVSDSFSLQTCIRVRWEHSLVGGSRVMTATVQYADHSSSITFSGVQAGEKFGIEHTYDGRFKFFRNRTSVTSFSLASPFASDAALTIGVGFPPSPDAQKNVRASVTDFWIY